MYKGPPISYFEIQVWLNSLATKYWRLVVRHCYSNIRSITHMAKKMNFLTCAPAKDVTMPQTKPVEKPQMAQKQILALIGGIHDLHDLCLLLLLPNPSKRSNWPLQLCWTWQGFVRSVVLRHHLETGGVPGA